MKGFNCQVKVEKSSKELLIKTLMARCGKFTKGSWCLLEVQLLSALRLCRKSLMQARIGPIAGLELGSEECTI